MTRETGIAGYETIVPLDADGGMHLARQIATDRAVILRVAAPGDDRRREVAALRLRHPNILEVLEVGVAPGGHFSVWQWLPSAESLSARLAREGMDPCEAARIAEGVARGVQHARLHGLCLDDLSPDLVVVRDADVPRLLPVFVEDPSPGTSARDDLARLAWLMGRLVEGRSGEAWDPLATLALRCAGRGEAPLASVDELVAALSGLTAAAPASPEAGPGVGARAGRFRFKVGRFTAGVVAAIVATPVTVASAVIGDRLGHPPRWEVMSGLFLAVTGGVMLLGEEFGLIADPYRNPDEDPLSLRGRRGGP